MQLRWLPSAPPNLLAEPLGILSQENKGNVPGQKQFSSPGICSQSLQIVWKPVWLCPIPPWLCHGICQDSVTSFPLARTARMAQAEQFTALSNLLARTDGGVRHLVSAQCQLNEFSLFHALLDYFSPRLFSFLKSNRYLNLWTAVPFPGNFGISVCCTQSDGFLLLFHLLFSHFLWGFEDFFFHFHCIVKPPIGS